MRKPVVTEGDICGSQFSQSEESVLGDISPEVEGKPLSILLQILINSREN